MKVSELIEALQEFDGDLEIIAGTDDEGNDYQTPYFPSLSWCVEDEGYRCGFYPVDDDDVAEGEYEGYELVQKVVL